MTDQPVFHINTTNAAPDDLHEQTVGGVPSTLDDLVSDLAELPLYEPIVVAIPRREGWAARCSPNITAQQIKKWRQTSRDRQWQAGDLEETQVDNERFFAQVLAETCEALMKDGRDVLDPETHKPITFRSTSFAVTQKRPGELKLPSHVDVVLRFFGNDAHVSKAAAKVLEVAADEDADDPFAD